MIKLRHPKKFFSFLKHNKVLNLIIFTAPAILFAYVVYLRYENADLIEKIADEDALFEYLQFLFFTLAFITSLLITIKRFKNKQKLLGALYAIVTFLLFFWTMEEISWGQRIFNFDEDNKLVKLFVGNNYQGETTVHNLNFFGYSIDWGFMFIGMIGSVLAWIKINAHKSQIWRFIKELIPTPKYFLYFLYIAIIYTTRVLIRGKGWTWWTDNMNWRESETAEFVLSVAVFLILFGTFWKLRKKK